MMDVTEEQIEAGQAVYSNFVLSLYDLLVLGFSNRFIWKCRKRITQKLYSDHISTNHLEIGVGTGYFLDKCKLSPDARIALLDLNDNCLKKAANRIRRFRPELYQADVLKPIRIPSGRFSSCGMNFLFHCLPGAIESKMAVFDNLKEIMAPGAKVFGTTVLHEGIHKSFFAKKLMKLYNEKKIFSNSQDHLKGLVVGLEKRFKQYDVKVIGCIAVFTAQYG